MATFVFVHPAWLGGWCWKKVGGLLRSAGHEVFAPTLSGLGERAHLASPEVGLTTHIDDVTNVLVFEDLTNVVLVGNSSGGTVITGVADRVPERVAALVYLDAFVPSDGQSTRDLLPTERKSALDGLVETEGHGWLLPRFAPPPWEVIVRDMWQIIDAADVEWVLPRLRATPYRHFTEALRLRDMELDDVRRVYVRCPRNPAPFDVFAAVARSSPDWTYREIDAPHIAYITHPNDVSAVLLETTDLL